MVKQIFTHKIALLLLLCLLMMIPGASLLRWRQKKTAPARIKSKQQRRANHER